MKRALPLALAVVAIVALLVVFGVISIQVSVNPPGNASARPFWQEKGAEGELPKELRIWVDLAKAVKPAVVNVSTTERVRRGPLTDEFFRRFFGEEPPRARTSLGSGVIASPDGYIVTNYHVVRDGAEIVVRLSDHRELRAQVTGTDPATDIALLKIDGQQLPTLPFGDSDHLQVGEPVMAIGNPFGLEHTVTTGIVSAKERFIGSGPYDDFIQTDASVNPGNSGGPLIDAHGALVGINSAIFSESGGWMGIGFAIPVNLAKEVLPQLKQRGRMTRGYLGVAVTPLPRAPATAGAAPAAGAQVRDVVADSPAARAGIKPGDVIAAFQGTPIHSPHELTRRVAATPPGTTVSLTVHRKQGEETLSATLTELRRQAR
jgi:serine protease Do